MNNGTVETGAIAQGQSPCPLGHRPGGPVTLAPSPGRDPLGEYERTVRLGFRESERLEGLTNSAGTHEE